MQKCVFCLVLLMMSIILFGCPEKGTNPPKSKTEIRRVGWTGDNYFPSKEAIRDSGASPSILKSVNGHLIMQDSYHKGVDASRIFIRKIGEPDWEIIEPPDSVDFFGIGWIVDSENVYFGADKLPRLYKYELATSSWQEIPISIADSVVTQRGVFPKEPHSPYGIPCIANYHDSLVILIANSASDGWTYPELNLWGVKEGGVWSGKRDSLSENDAWLDYKVFEDQLYVATYGKGVWRLLPDRTWEQLPPPDYITDQYDTTAILRPRALEVVNGNLYVSYLGWGHVYRYNKAKNTWTDVAQCDSGRVCYPKPRNNMTMTQYKGRLIAAGMEVPVPVWYNDTTGEWTWLSYETWKSAFPTSDYLGPTYGMTVAGDTLYVAHENGMVKLNLADPAVWTADTTDATTIEIPIEEGNEL